MRSVRPAPFDQARSLSCGDGGLPAAQNTENGLYVAFYPQMERSPGLALWASMNFSLETNTPTDPRRTHILNELKLDLTADRARSAGESFQRHGVAVRV